jgi:hypothetical protein
MFLSRVRRKTTFQELGYQYGCGKESARKYCKEMTNIFREHFVPQLVFPRPPEELKAMARPEVLEKYPDLLAILDATNWEQLKPENFLENRLSYSAYKHNNVFQVLLGELRYLGRFDTDLFLCSFSCFDRKVGALALGNLWGHFE